MQPPAQVEGHPGVAIPPAGHADIAQPARWTLATKVAFRFAFVFFPLYNLWIPLHFIPIPFLVQANRAFWNLLVTWTAANLLHVRLVFSPLNSTNGSKDTTANYVQLLCYLAVTAAITVVWSVADRKRPNYQRLYDWFRLYLRMVLAAIMIPYGAAKLFQAQFPSPSLSTLLEPYGNSSPMHLLWTFMGASPSYSFFAGAVEVLGGALLIVPRLTTLGALISAAAMGNVLMLNIGYDVPVKIFTFNLVLMSVLLLLPDLKRLANFFVFNRKVEPAEARPLFKRKRLNQLALALQLLFGIVLLGQDLYHRERDARRVVEIRSETPLYGIWSVEEFTVDGQVVPPLLTDPVRWQRLVVESSEGVMVQAMNGSPQYFALSIDPAKKSFSMTKPNDWTWRTELTYDNLQPDVLTLRGQMDGHQMAVTLRRVSESQFLLMNRGFHWINEYPVNH